MGQEINKKELLNRYRKCKTCTYALKKALPRDMSLETAKLYLKVLDDVESAIERLEGDLYVSEKDPDFDNLKHIYAVLFSIKENIDLRFE